MRRIAFAALFVAAVVLLGNALAVWRAAVLHPGAAAWLRVALTWGGLAAVILALMAMMYAAERAAGNVRRRLRLFDWALRGRGSDA